MQLFLVFVLNFSLKRTVEDWNVNLAFAFEHANISRHLINHKFLNVLLKLWRNEEPLEFFSDHIKPLCTYNGWWCMRAISGLTWLWRESISMEARDNSGDTLWKESLFSAISVTREVNNYSPNWRWIVLG